MRRLLLLVALFGACAAVWQVRADGSFTDSLSPEEIHRAGLDKLSPEERAALDDLVRRHETPAPATAPAAVDARNPQAPQPPAAQESDALRHSSAVSSSVVTIRPGTRVIEEAVESRILGKFTGWEGRTVFKLENGQRWQVANPGSGYWCPAIENPKVRITRSSLGGYWMVIEDVELRVRVKLVR